MPLWAPASLILNLAEFRAWQATKYPVPGDLQYFTPTFSRRQPDLNRAYPEIATPVELHGNTKEVSFKIFRQKELFTNA